MTTERHSFRKIPHARLLAFISLTFTVLAGLLPLEAQSSPANQDFLVIVPHTHWEGAVFKTREEYLQIGLPHIIKALTLLKAYPDYRFVLDQMCYVKPF